MQRKILTSLWAAIVTATLAMPCAAADRKGDEDAIHKATAQYVRAAKQGDSGALTSLWTPDGEYIDAQGKPIKVRDLFGKESSGADAQRPTRDITIQSSRLRFVAPEVAIEDGVAEVRSAGAEPSAPSRYTAVWVKQGGKWLLDNLREAPAPAPATKTSTPTDLEGLAWLVGDFTGSFDKTAYDFSSKFLEEKQVVERKYSIRSDDRVLLEGTQYINLDPDSGAITSHSSDSRGDQADGVWSRDDDGSWTVDTQGRTPEGDEITSTSVFIPHDDGTFTWSVLDTTVDGEAMPDVTLKLSRKATK